jgi:hypothetical protein
VVDDDRGFIGSLFDFSFDSTISGALIRILYRICLIGGGFLALLLALRSLGGRNSSPLPLIIALIMYFIFVVFVRFILESMMTLGKIAEYTRRPARLLEQVAQAPPTARLHSPSPAAQSAATHPHSAAAPVALAVAGWVADPQTAHTPATAPPPLHAPAAPPQSGPAIERLARHLFSSPELGELPRVVWEWAHGGDNLALRRVATTALAYAQLSPQSRQVVEARVSVLGHRSDELRRAVLALS